MDNRKLPRFVARRIDFIVPGVLIFIAELFVRTPRTARNDWGPRNIGKDHFILRWSVEGIDVSEDEIGQFKVATTR